MVHRNDVRTGLVVGLHHDFIIRAGFQRRADFNHKSWIAALVRPCQPAVYIHFRTGPYPFKTQKHTLVFQVSGTEKVFLVVAHPFIEIIIPNLHIPGIPCMRDLHCFPFTLPLGSRLHRIGWKRAFLELPARVERGDIAGDATTANKQTGKQQTY